MRRYTRAMATASRRVRTVLVLIGVGAAVLVAAVVGMTVLRPVEATGVTAPSPDARAERPATAAEMRSAAVRASAALRAGDRAAWDASLPAAGRVAGSLG